MKREPIKTAEFQRWKALHNQINNDEVLGQQVENFWFIDGATHNGLTGNYLVDAVLRGVSK